MDDTVGLGSKLGPSEAVLELGRQYARDDQSFDLGPGEQRPALYYSVNHATGKSDIPADAHEPTST